MSNLTPLEHFCVVYQARVENTGQKIISGMNIPPHLPQGVPVQNVDLTYKTENEIAIYMGEEKFSRFIENHMRIVSLMYGVVEDKRIKDQFEKLMILVNLTK